MTFGLQLFDAGGATVFDSNVAFAGVPVGMYALGAADTLSTSYPAHTGRTIELIFFDEQSTMLRAAAVITYPSSVPTLNVSAPGGDMAFLIVVY